MGEVAIIGISLDVASLVLSADPALSKNCFAHLETLQTLLKKTKDNNINGQTIDFKWKI